MPILVGGGSNFDFTSAGVFPFAPRRNDVVQVEPYIRLYEIEVPGTPPTRYRLCAYPEVVEFGTNSSGAKLSYYPFPIEHTESRENLEGALPEVELRVSNVSREIVQVLRANRGLVGQPVRYMLVNAADLASNQPVRREDYEIVATPEISESLVVFRIGQDTVARQKFPANRITGQCDHAYKGNRCGYTGAIVGCDKSRFGVNGCQVHNNLDRYGGWTIPRRAGLLG